MKFEDALKLLRQGKKIRRSCWSKNIYLVLTKNGATAYADDEQWDYGMTIQTILENDWEVYEEPILDKEEKEYLSAVIKPFKDKINGIMKSDAKGLFEYITMYLGGNDKVILPNFKKGTMYKGMKLYKIYTLKELGL